MGAPHANALLSPWALNATPGLAIVRPGVCRFQTVRFGPGSVTGNKMAKEYSRTQRIGDQMQRELAQLIRREIKDPVWGWSPSPP